jgi:hypothetical protein
MRPETVALPYKNSESLSSPSDTLVAGSISSSSSFSSLEFGGLDVVERCFPTEFTLRVNHCGSGFFAFPDFVLELEVVDLFLEPASLRGSPSGSLA